MGAKWALRIRLCRLSNIRPAQVALRPKFPFGCSVIDKAVASFSDPKRVLGAFSDRSAPPLPFISNNTYYQRMTPKYHLNYVYQILRSAQD